MAFELFILQIFFVSMAGLVLYMNRNMLAKVVLSPYLLSEKRRLDRVYSPKIVRATRSTASSSRPETILG